MHGTFIGQPSVVRQKRAVLVFNTFVELPSQTGSHVMLLGVDNSGTNRHHKFSVTTFSTGNWLQSVEVNM